MFPFYRQLDLMDCGPTCLAMIAKHFGQQVNRNHLRELCAFVKKGLSLLSISKAAESIWFKVVGGRLSFKILSQETPFP